MITASDRMQHVYPPSEFKKNSVHFYMKCGIINLFWNIQKNWSLLFSKVVWQKSKLLKLHWKFKGSLCTAAIDFLVLRVNYFEPVFFLFFYSFLNQYFFSCSMVTSNRDRANLHFDFRFKFKFHTCNFSDKLELNHLLSMCMLQSILNAFFQNMKHDLRIKID